MLTETAVNRFINSRALTWIIALAGIATSYALLHTVGASAATDVDGLFGDGLDHLLPPGTLSWGVNIAVIFVAAVMLNWLNKTYVFIREHTMMFVTVFLSTTLFNPEVSLSLNTSSLLALVLVVSTYVMFATFQQRDRRSVAFLITAILTVGAMQSFVFALYIPVFLIGFIQMRTFSFKTLLAMVIGIVVPLWVATAFAWIDPTQVRMPHLVGSMSELEDSVDPGALLHTLFVVAVGTILGISNILTLMSYRQQLRAYNGFLNIMAVATVLFMAVDIANVRAYIVIINMLTALQAAHFFTIRRLPKLYVAFFALLIADIVLSAVVMLKMHNLL